MREITSLVILFIFSCSVFAQNNENESINTYNAIDSYLLFELGASYPKLQFVDSDGIESLISDEINISGSRLAIGRGGKLVSRLGYLLTLSSNRYELRTHYLSTSRNDVRYSFDYASLEANLTFRLLQPSSKWSPLLKAGLSYNYLVSGFQEFEGQTIYLRDNEDYSNGDFDVNLGLHLRRKITQYSHFWLGYNYKLGFMEKEKISKQQYNINAHSALLGFSVSTDAFMKKDASDGYTFLRGRLRVRDIPPGDVSTDQVLVADFDGNIRGVPSNLIGGGDGNPIVQIERSVQNAIINVDTDIFIIAQSSGADVILPGIGPGQNEFAIGSVLTIKSLANQNGCVLDLQGELLEPLVLNEYIMLDGESLTITATAEFGWVILDRTVIQVGN